jgi:DNA repair protein RadD
MTHDAHDAFYTEGVERNSRVGVGARYKENASGASCASCASAPPAAASPLLRPYQTALVDRLRAAYRLGFRAPLLQLATGGGKTVVFAAAAHGARAKGKRVLVLAHRIELVRQAADKLAAAGVPAVMLVAGGTVPPNAPAVVASIQTAANRLDRLGDFDFIVIDEAHHCTATTWRKVLDAFPTAKLLGVSATPWRLDGKGLGVGAGGIFDVLVEGPSIAELTRAGYLAPARYYVPERKIDTTNVPQVAGDYSAAGLEALMTGNSRITGDAIDSYRRHADHQPAICFVVSVHHGEIVAAQFREAGYRAACVHGELAAAERDRLIAGLGNGDIEVLASCQLISEGLDVPAVGAVVLLRPTASLGLHLQQIGRGLRPAPGKAHLTVLDHVGNVLEHGRADDARAWTLDAGLARAAGKREATVKRCHVCGAGNALAARWCESCGTKFPVDEPDFNPAPGRLVELSRERIQFLATQPHHRLRGMTLSEAEVRAVARERGYKAGWCRHYLREQAARSAQ